MFDAYKLSRVRVTIESKDLVFYFGACLTFPNIPSLCNCRSKELVFVIFYFHPKILKRIL